MNELITQISENLQKGKSKAVKTLVQQALDAGCTPAEILNDGLIAGMNVVGVLFRDNKMFVPEVLMSARAMNTGASLLKPYLSSDDSAYTGKVCIGTVKGDLHDIGKKLVAMMIEGKGIEVIDLGVDVEPDVFIETAIREDCKVICCSALLTSTMPMIAEVVKKAEEAGIRDKVKIMIGGAPVTQAFCDSVGADCYTPDAASAAEKASEFLSE